MVEPRLVSCLNSFPHLGDGEPLRAWIVLEEMPGTRDGYVIIFYEEQGVFGLAIWDEITPVLVGFYGSFLDTLQAM
jgi:hypothetical protein